MNLFEAVKQNVTTRQAAERYGIRIRRNGMAVCPFHNDKNPSMKLDRRFHCFGCQADGDAVDFVSRLFGLPSKEAAMKIADDFGISYDSRQKPSIRPKIREPTPEQKYQQEENHCYKVLSDYFHLLRKWESNTHRNGRMKCGTRFLWKHWRRKAISNTCWIFFSMTLPKKRKLL